MTGIMTVKFGNIFITTVFIYCLLGPLFSSANPSPKKTAVALKVADEKDDILDNPPPGDDEIDNSTIHRGTPCSSKPYEEYPCGMKQHKGFFGWVEDSRNYEWIYMAFCISLGACIFIFVVSAAIYNASYYKTREARRLAKIQADDERARKAVTRGERRGSHIAQPRRASLSVHIEDPATMKDPSSALLLPAKK